MTGKAILAWYGYLAIMPQNHLNNVTVTGPARSNHDRTYSPVRIANRCSSPTPHPTADGLLEGPTPDFCD